MKSTPILRLFDEADFSWLKRWVTSAELLVQFAGTEFEYPLTLNQLTAYQSMYPTRRFYVAMLEDTPFAFGEIIPQESGHPRLGRILVGEISMRGLGLGSKFVAALLEECRRLYYCHSVDLNVWDENTAAIRCYEKVGFVFSPDERFVLHALGRIYNIRKMTWHHCD